MCPKVVDHDERRAEIMAGVVPLFVARGYTALGVRELAAHLGISKSALYHYFPTKEALFDATCAAILSADLRLLSGLPRPEAVGARVEHLFAAHAEQEEDYAHNLVILVDYARATPPDRREPLRRAAAAYARAFAEYLGVGEADGRMVFLLINGLVLERWLEGGQPDFAELAQRLKAYLTVRAAFAGGML